MMCFAQVPERLYYLGHRIDIDEYPLEKLFERQGERPAFVMPHTGLFRGYVATWEVKNARLYLTGIDAMYENGKKATIKDLFATDEARVEASWYTGEIRIPDGELENTIHLAYTAVYERDLIVCFKDGVVTETRIEKNYATG